YYREEFAWVDPDGDPTVKSSYKFPHHHVSTDGTIGDANIKACQSAIGVLNGGMGGSQIPASDHAAVHDHLAAHLKDAGLDVAPLKENQESSPDRQYRSFTIPNVSFRAQQDGQPARVSGHASVFNTPSEPLWCYGGAREIIVPGAFTRAIGQNPDDVRLLINHDPNLVLARNTANTLTLREDGVGLYFE